MRLYPPPGRLQRHHGNNERMAAVALALMLASAPAALSTFGSPLPLLRATNFTQVGAWPKGAGAGTPSDYVAPAFLSNGFYGLRVGPIPLLADPYAGTARPTGPYPLGTPTVPCVLGGYMHRDPKGRSRVLAAAPFPFETDVIIDGAHSLRDDPGMATVRSQVFDMRDGTLRTELMLRVDGGCVELSVTQFASRSDPSLAVMRVVARSSPATLRVVIRPAITYGGYNKSSGQGVPGTKDKEEPDVVSNWTWDPCFSLSLVSDCGSRMGMTAKGISTTSSTAAPNDTVTYDLVASSVSGMYGPQDAMLEAYLAMEQGLYIGGFDELLRRNMASWAEIWQGRIEFEGSGFTTDDQAMLDGAFFYLHSNSHPNSRHGSPPYGLTQSGICYFGGLFWDMDSFMTKPTAMSSPSAGVALARSRTRTVGAAQRLAELLGYHGANGRAAVQYPWTASMVDGHDTTSCGEGWKEQHISLDVALAVWEAASAAGNPSFWQGEAWPVISGVCEWIMARGVTTERGFEIHNIEGPDESIGKVNNSNYVNVAAMMVLERAIEGAKLLPASMADPGSVARWNQTLDRFYLATEGDVVLPFDGAQVSNCTVHSWSIGNLAYLFSHGLPERISHKMLEATFAVEEKLRTNFSTSSSLPCRGAPYFACPPIAGQAALAGERAKAADLMRLLRRNYTLPPFQILKEYSGYNFGMYMTTPGSFLSTLYSMMGLDIGAAALAPSSTWLARNATFPLGWDRVKARVSVRGQLFSASGAHGEKLTLTPQDGTEQRPNMKTDEEAAGARPVARALHRTNTSFVSVAKHADGKWWFWRGGKRFFSTGVSNVNDGGADDGAGDVLGAPCRAQENSSACGDTNNWSMTLKMSPYRAVTQALFNASVVGAAAAQEAWAAEAAVRLEGWNFNTAGGYSSAYGEQAMAARGMFYNRLLMFATRFTMPTGTALEQTTQGGCFGFDIFSESWERQADEYARVNVLPRANDVALLGWHFEKEVSWKKMNFRYLLNLQLFGASSATSKNATAWLRDRYGDAKALATAWNCTKLESISASALASCVNPPGYVADCGGHWQSGPPSLNMTALTADSESYLVAVFAKRYFEVVTSAIHKYDRNHLLLGMRGGCFGSQALLVLFASYVDVYDLHSYADVDDGGALLAKYEQVHTITGLPILHGEFSYTALDANIPNLKGARHCAANSTCLPGRPYVLQRERAAAAEAQSRKIAAVPYLVGYHWWYIQYKDPCCDFLK